jgi:hypothetical protein
MSLADRRARRGVADGSYFEDVEGASRDVPHAADVDLLASAGGVDARSAVCARSAELEGADWVLWFGASQPDWVSRRRDCEWMWVYRWGHGAR